MIMIIIVIIIIIIIIITNFLLWSWLHIYKSFMSWWQQECKI